MGIFLGSRSSRSEAYSTKSYDNNGECGYCLKLIDSKDCPSSVSSLPDCREKFTNQYGDLCEADSGNCGTDDNANNCGIYDVYRVVECSNGEDDDDSSNNNNSISAGMDLSCSNTGSYSSWPTLCYQDGYPYDDTFLFVVCTDRNVDQAVFESWAPSATNPYGGMDLHYKCMTYIGEGRTAPRTVNAINDFYSGATTVCEYSKLCFNNDKDLSLNTNCDNLDKPVLKCP